MKDYLFRVPGGKTFKYQFSPETTIAMIKKKICELNKYDLLKTRLIHRCSILNDDTKIQDIEITPIEYIVIQPYSSIPASIDCKIGKFPELQPPKPLLPSEIAEALKNLESVDQSHKESVKALLEMGFSLQDSIRGLRSTGYMLEEAAEYLTSDCYDNENANDFRRLDRENVKKERPLFNNSFLQSGLQLPPLPPLNSLGPLPGAPMNPPNISVAPQNGQPVNSSNQPFGQNQYYNPSFPQIGPLLPQSQQDLSNPHNQYFEYRILTPEQKRDVDQLAQQYNHLPFDIILQFYQANDKNVEKTRDALK